MDINGIQKTSLIDYPGKICTTLFLKNCNFRCGYCHNSELVEGNTIPSHKSEEVLTMLNKRKNIINSVCITGGEPTQNKDLIEFLKELKNEKFNVKLDTNGSNPEIIKEIIKNKLVDYIAMDIKVPFERYDEFGFKKEVIETSNIIINSGINHEFRTTVVPNILNKKDIIQISKDLKNSKKYVLQQFRNKFCLNKEFEKVNPYSKNELEDMKEECNKFVKTELRI